jgi:Spy/CpxP family protein refolding chaperone
MNTKKALAVLLAVGLSASLAFAQHQPNTATMVQRHVQHLTTLLTLDSGQQQKITGILNEAASGSSSFRTEMKTARQNLQTAIKNNDANAIQAAATALGNQMAQQIVAHAKTQAAIRQVLTSDQQTKMDELEKGGGGGPFGGRGHFMH